MAKRFVFFSTFYVDFIFADIDKILDKFIFLFGIFLGHYFMPTLPSRYGMFPKDWGYTRGSEVTEGDIT